MMWVEARLSPEKANSEKAARLQITHETRAANLGRTINDIIGIENEPEQEDAAPAADAGTGEQRCPQTGSIVHYIDVDAVHCAAMVLQVFGADCRKLCLRVFKPRHYDYELHWIDWADESQLERNTWHWPAAMIRAGSQADGGDSK